tara:strand:+ start:743 stop:1429 length:687 start_codon:yes stop_codon:yes gene_type:complete
MDKRNFKQIDLLRNRREADNLASPYFTETKKYIKKGIFKGLSLIVISIILGIPFIYRINYLENNKNKIKVFSDEYDLLVKKLKDEQKQFNNIASFNEKLKDSIINVSSSSALFKEISLIIPKDIQLLEFLSQGNALIFKAKLPKTEYLKIINSFLINLDNSELVKFNQIDLKKINSTNVNSSDEEYLIQINTRVSTNYNELNEKYLTKLGSYGLLNRINILKNIDKSF